MVGDFLFFSEPYSDVDNLIYRMNSFLFLVLERKSVMNEKLQNVFKSTPQRFHSVIDSAIKEAQQNTASKKSKRVFMRVVIVAAIIVLLASVTVVGTVKLFMVEPQKSGDYGISMLVSKKSDGYEYIKMHIEIPDGFEEVQNTARAKYHRKDSGEYAFSILPMRIKEDTKLENIETNVKELQEIEIASHKAYKIIPVEETGLLRYYVVFENVDVLMLIYRGETITDAEFESFVRGINFSKGTKEDHDEFYELTDNKDDDTIMVSDKSNKHDYVELDLDTEVVFGLYSELSGNNDLKVNSKIKDIRITDNINDLDRNGINSSYNLDEIVDKNGKLLPDSVKIWQKGDGVNTAEEVIRIDSEEQSLVLIDMEFENTSDEDVQLYIPHRLSTLKKESDGSFVPTAIIDKDKNITASAYCDTEIFYLSDYGESEKRFYIPVLKAKEKKTITIGIRCCTSQLSNAYITLSGVFDSVVSPEYRDYSDNEYTYYIFKVQ